MRTLKEVEFISLVEKTESLISNLKADSLEGRVIFYFDDYVERQGGKLTDTKIEDIENITKSSFCRTFIGDFDGSGLLQVMTIRRANLKEFKGIYKFVPTNAICLEYFGLTPKNEVRHSKFALVQKEDLSFKCLDRNKALRIRKELPKEYYETDERIARLVTNCYFDITESYGIAYDFKGITFIYPLTLEDIKESFKNREKDNLRKSVLPTMVHRNGKDFLRMGDNGFDLKGRHFYFATGLLNTQYMSISNKNKLVDLKESSAFVDGECIVKSKGKERIIVTGGLE